MANELRFADRGYTGQTLYVLLFLDGQAWNTATPGWEDFVVANWLGYAVTMTESVSGSGLFLADLPAGINVASVVDIQVFEQSGAQPADTDLMVGIGEYDGRLSYLDASVATRFPAASYVGPPTTSGIAAAILSDPSHKLATGADGGVIVDSIADSAISSSTFTVGTLSANPSGILEKLVMLWRVLFKSSAKDASNHTLTYFADDGSTPLATVPYTDDGAGNQTRGAAS